MMTAVTEESASVCGEGFIYPNLQTKADDIEENNADAVRKMAEGFSGNHSFFFK